MIRQTPLNRKRPGTCRRLRQRGRHRGRRWAQRSPEQAAVVCLRPPAPSSKSETVRRRRRDCSCCRRTSLRTRVVGTRRHSRVCVPPRSRGLQNLLRLLRELGVLGVHGLLRQGLQHLVQDGDQLVPVLASFSQCLLGSWPTQPKCGFGTHLCEAWTPEHGAHT